MHGPAMRISRWQPVPTNVTLHDAMPWLLNEAEWPDGMYRQRLLPSAFRRAVAMITDSESSRQDIVTLWPAVEPKVHVIPPWRR